MNLFSVAYAADQATQQPGGDWLSMIIIVFVFIAIMYFVSIKPSKKAQKEKEELLSKILVGDEIILRSGICGKVVEYKAESEYAVISLSENVNVTVAKVYIMNVIPKGTIGSMK